MKKFFPLLIAAYLLYSLAGCSNNSVTGPSAGNVTFSISQQTGQSGGIDFLGKPSVDVKLTKVISQLPSNNISDTAAPPPTYVYSKDTFYIISNYSGVTTGQKWDFIFTGATNSGNTAFNVTSSYTVP